MTKILDGGIDGPYNEPDLYAEGGRDMDLNPYSPDEQRVADFFFGIGIGGGDDPIGSLLARQVYLERFRDEVDLLEKNARIQGKLLADTARENGRLRAIVRVNLMRSEGATHEEIDRILDDGIEPPAVFRS